jgi:hypothetical protein
VFGGGCEVDDATVVVTDDSEILVRSKLQTSAGGSNLLYCKSSTLVTLLAQPARRNSSIMSRRTPKILFIS